MHYNWINKLRIVAVFWFDKNDVEFGRHFVTMDPVTKSMNSENLVNLTLKKKD